MEQRDDSHSLCLSRALGSMRQTDKCAHRLARQRVSDRQRENREQHEAE